MFNNYSNYGRGTGRGRGRGRGGGPSTNYGLGYIPPTVNEDKNEKLFSIIETGDYHEIHEALTSHKYNPKVFNENGESIIHVLLKSDNSELSTENKIYILRLLKTFGVSMNNRDLNGVRPLHIACQQQDNNLTKFFLKEDRTTDVNTPDINKQTPIHYAVQGKIIEEEPEEDPVEEIAPIPKSLKSDPGAPDFKESAYKIKKDYITNFFRRRGIYKKLQDEYLELPDDLAIALIEGQQGIDEHADESEIDLVHRIMRRIVALQIIAIFNDIGKYNTDNPVNTVTFDSVSGSYSYPAGNVVIRDKLYILVSFYNYEPYKEMLSICRDLYFNDPTITNKELSKELFKKNPKIAAKLGPPFKLTLSKSLPDKFFAGIMLSLSNRNLSNFFDIGCNLIEDPPRNTLNIKTIIFGNLISRTLSQYYERKPQIDDFVSQIIRVSKKIQDGLSTLGTKEKNNNNWFDNNNDNYISSCYKVSKKKYYFPLEYVVNGDSKIETILAHNGANDQPNFNFIKWETTPPHPPPGLAHPPNAAIPINVFSGEQLSDSDRMFFERFLCYALDSEFALKDLQACTLFTPNNNYFTQLQKDLLEEIKEKIGSIKKKDTILPDVELQIIKAFKNTIPSYTIFNQPVIFDNGKTHKIDIASIYSYIEDFSIIFKNEVLQNNKEKCINKLKKILNNNFTEINNDGVKRSDFINECIKYAFQNENQNEKLLHVKIGSIVAAMHPTPVFGMNTHLQFKHALNLDNIEFLKKFKDKNVRTKLANDAQFVTELKEGIRKSVHDLCTEDDQLKIKIQEIITNFINEKMGFGELEDMYKSTFSDLLPGIKSMSFEYKYTPPLNPDLSTDIYNSNNSNLDVNEFPYSPVPAKYDNLSHRKHGGNPPAFKDDPNIGEHEYLKPKLSSFGTDIFRYVGQLIRRIYNRIDMEELIQSTVHCVFLACIIKLNMENKDIFITDNNEDKQYIYVFDHLLKESNILNTDHIPDVGAGVGPSGSILHQILLHLFSNDTLQEYNNPPGIFNRVAVGRKPTHGTGKIDDSQNKALETVTKYFTAKTLPSVDNSIIESIIPFASKIEGMVVQSMQLNDMHKKFYHLDKRQTVIDQLAEANAKEKDNFDLYTVLSNLDMYSSKDNLEKYHKFIMLDKKLIENLLKRKCNINTVDKFNRTPLHYAISYLGLPIIKNLINKGAKIWSCGINNAKPPFLFLLESFENYCRPISDPSSHKCSSTSKVSLGNTDSDNCKYSGLWNHLVSEINNSNKSHSIPIFKHIFEEFIRNINRHVLYQGFYSGDSSKSYNDNPLIKSMLENNKEHLFHSIFTEHLVKLISKIKNLEWLKHNRDEMKKEIKMIIEILDSLHIGEDEDNLFVKTLFSNSKKEELIGQIKEIKTTSPKIITLYGVLPNIYLKKDDELVIAHNDYNNKTIKVDKYTNTKPNEIKVKNKLKEIQDNTYPYIYVIRDSPVYSISKFRKIILENTKMFNVTNEAKPDIDEYNVQNNILDRIVNITVFTIIKNYIIDYEIKEAFVNFLYNIVEDDASKIREEIEIIINDKKKEKKTHLYDNLQKFGLQCIYIFFYKNMTVEEVENHSSDPMISLETNKKSIIESIKAIGRLPPYSVDLKNDDALIKKMNEETIPRYIDVLHLFLTNLRKLFLHYINYIENQYKYLKVLEMTLEKLEKM